METFGIYLAHGCTGMPVKTQHLPSWGVKGRQGGINKGVNGAAKGVNGGGKGRPQGVKGRQGGVSRAARGWASNRNTDLVFEGHDVLDGKTVKRYKKYEPKPTLPNVRRSHRLRSASRLGPRVGT
ncbi:hypothetical protein B0H13DRAFT_1865115 [Mycena leptocephala]|nr:hypothetical protein B0H13DRAFT_1865115 [Mycena leptocephala]